MTYEEIKNNEEINSYIRQADASLVALGFTEHSFAHVTLVPYPAVRSDRRHQDRGRRMQRLGGREIKSAKNPFIHRFLIVKSGLECYNSGK